MLPAIPFERPMDKPQTDFGTEIMREPGSRRSMCELNSEKNVDKKSEGLLGRQPLTINEEFNMSQDDNQDNVTNLNEQSNSTPVRPIVSFAGSGGLNLAVWKQKSENDFDHYSIRLDRSYKQEDGTYKTTSYLRESDLLMLVLAG